MLWMELTSERFGEAIEKSEGVCLLPTGCMERHGPHLPLGTDQIAVDAVAQRAAEIEPAVVFPSYYFGQIAEARHCPGTYSLPNELVLQLLFAVLDEIGRNGFPKIMIVNGHGGNNGLLDYLMFTLLQRPRDYTVYRAKWGMEEEDAKKWKEMKESPSGHAGEGETSTMCYLCPQGVHMEDVKGPEDWASRGWLKDLENVTTPLWWYADHPTHITGDPTRGNAEKGEFLINASARRLARTIRAVKDDTITPDLMKSYYEKGAHPGPDLE